MSKKLTIALDEKQYDWVGRNGNASYAIRELIDADMKRDKNYKNWKEINFKNGNKINIHKSEYPEVKALE